MFARIRDFLSSYFNTQIFGAYKRQVQLRQTSGYIAPVLIFLLTPTRYITAFWRWIQLGCVKLVNPEIRSSKERLIYCPNHSSYFDAIVMHSVFKNPAHYMCAVEEFRGLFGLRALLFSSLGAFAVDRSKGSSVIAPAVEVLVRGEQLIIFPEGKIYLSGKLGQFKAGPAVIAQRACARLEPGTRVGIVPVHIAFGKRNVETASSYNFFKIGFSWRGGVTVHFGEPIWVNEHSELSADELMNLVRQGILKFPSPTSGE